MKKSYKSNLIILLVFILILLILSGVFYIFDYNRVKKQQVPVFCIRTKTYRDGGTSEYRGLGYKVIVYNKLDGYDKIHIGSWFMKYDDSLSGVNEIINID